MRATRTKQALWTLAALCFPATLHAMHPHPIRIAPIPPARTRYISQPAHHPANPTHKPNKNQHLGLPKKVAREPRHSRHEPRLKAVSAPRRDKRNPARPIVVAQKPSYSEPLTPVVSIIRQNSIHPQLQPIEELAASTQILPTLYGSDGRLAMPPALRGSHEILVHQNQMADQDGLTRVQDDEDLLQLRASKELVPLPVNEGLRIDERLPLDRRFCRPWVAQFLLELGSAHYAQFHTPLQINSAVRTVAFQARLLRTNGNAAQIGGEAASPHLTGQAVDLAKRGLPQRELVWIRLFLQALIEQSAIDVEEEFQQSCFHLSVYRRYSPPSPRQKIASTHRPLAPAIAAAIE